MNHLLNAVGAGSLAVHSNIVGGTKSNHVIGNHMVVAEGRSAGRWRYAAWALIDNATAATGQVIERLAHSSVLGILAAPGAVAYWCTKMLTAALAVAL